MWRGRIMAGLLLTFSTWLPIAPAQQRKGAEPAPDKEDSLLLPGLFHNKYKVDPYIEVAAALQELGKEKAVQALKDGELGAKEFGSHATFVLCRMLFVAKKGSEFRRPALGEPHFHARGLIGDWKRDWPLEPIALVDGVPFCIVRGYILEGKPESPSRYLHYCEENCDWNNYRFGPKSKAEKQAAFEKLIPSPGPRGLQFSAGREALKAQIE